MATDFLSWAHFGDLHIRNADDENYLDLLNLIAEVNNHLAGDVDFAFLPGDNADDGTENQYKLVRSALNRLGIPVHVITGDHDKKGGSLDLFRQYLEPNLYRALDLGCFRLLFLNALDATSPTAFDFSLEQIDWVRAKMIEARSASLRIVVFMHLYPSELATQAGTFSALIREFSVEVISMGHTHYNELANDGCTIYETTRSTGQIEEGTPGFSITTIDGDVISWKFKERGPWPFVMITSPADERLITRPASPRHIIRDTVLIRAKVWGRVPGKSLRVTCSIDGAAGETMQSVDGHWEFGWNSGDVPDGIHRIAVRATHQSGEAQDEISVLVHRNGNYTPPKRSALDHENAIGAYPAKSIVGTQLGPNKNGTKGPWPSWR